MTNQSLKEQIVHELDNLTAEQQRYLLDVVRRMQQSSLPPGTPGDVLLAHMDTFDFAPGEVDAMMQAIEEGCERLMR